MDKPDISVIIPVYNVKNYLRRCVSSVLSQRGPSLEVLLVDDGSTDGSGALCDAIAAEDARVTVIHKPNGGLSSARNAGLDRAAGSYISFVDSDDFLEPDAYRDMLHLAQKFGTKLVCGGRYDVDSESGEKVIGLCPEREAILSGENLVRRIFTWNRVDTSACDKLFQRELFDGLRFPEGVVCEDVPVVYRACLRSGSAGMLPRPVYNYSHRPDSITTTAVSEKSFHFAAHTRRILEDIQKSTPQLLPEARYYYVRSLAHPMQLCIVTGTRREFRALYDQCRQELTGQLSFLRTSPLFPKKERRLYTLLALGLYEPAWRFHCLLKNRK